MVGGDEFFEGVYDGVGEVEEEMRVGDCGVFEESNDCSFLCVWGKV